MTGLAARRRRGVPWRVALGLVGVGLVVSLVAAWSSPPAQRWRADAAAADPVVGVTEVRIADSTFAPASLAVPVGAEVTWRWTDGEAHNVVFADGPASAVVADGAWSRTFDAPGEYRYTCTLHWRMDGRVVVR